MKKFIKNKSTFGASTKNNSITYCKSVVLS